MSKLRLSIAVGDYDRTRALIESAMRPARPRFFLTKAIEGIWHKRSIDANSCVCHDDMHLMVGLAPCQPHPDCSVFSELDGVRRQVPHNLTIG